DPARLGRAAGRVVLGIEVENDRLAAQVGELDGAAVVARELEVRCGLAFLDHLVLLNLGKRDRTVEPRLDVITLAVADLERALAFYRELGLESKGVIGAEWTDEATGAKGAVAMFELRGGLLLNLYPRTELAKDAAIPVGEPASGEFSLAQLVRTS